MSTNRPAKVLASWEAAARSARAPQRPASVRARSQLPVGLLVISAVILAVALVQPLHRPTTPGSAGTPSSSPGGSVVTPSAFPPATPTASSEFGPATWALDPAFPSPDLTARELHVLVWERACSSGKSTTGRMSEPLIVVGPGHMTITIGVRPLAGDQECPGAPGTPLVVLLPEPLGSRILLDGGYVPPAPPRAPAGPNPALQWGPVAAFQSPLQMDARNEGVLRITDQCTFLERGGERSLLAWPAERTRWNAGAASISFRTRSGNEVTVRDGDEIVLGGGGSSRAEGGGTGAEWASRLTWVSPPDASCLVDFRWEISEVEL